MIRLTGNTVSHTEFVELLRDASEAETLIEQGYRVLRRVRELFGAEVYADVHAEPSEAAGAYRVLKVVDMREPALGAPWNREGWADCHDAPVMKGGVIGDLIRRSEPTVLELSAEASDPFVDLPGHAMVLPIFRGGTAREWALFFKSSPWSAGPDDLLALTQVANMLSMAGERQELLDNVSKLKDRLGASLESILQGQRSIMPPAPPTVQGLTFAAWYEPSEEVGGDYYDFRDFGDGSYGAVVADVSGHGPPASVAMGMLRSVLLAYRAFDRPAGSVVTDVNRVLHESLGGHAGGARFVTALFVQVYPESGLFIYANAGHHIPRVRRRDGTVEAIPGRASPPLGILDHLDTVGASGTLESGDCMVMFTDGIIEAFGEDGSMFGTDRLDRAIAEAEPEPEAIIESIRRSVDAFGRGDAIDDRCALVIRRD